MNKKDKEEIMEMLKEIRFNEQLGFIILMVLMCIINIIIYYGLS